MRNESASLQDAPDIVKVRSLHVDANCYTLNKPLTYYLKPSPFSMCYFLLSIIV